jgi:hypothetical protein
MDIRDLYSALSVEMVEDYVTNGREEDLHLDFKTATPALNRDDRRNFAVAASGFANSEGGLIIWGVEARKDSEGIDRACGKPGIAGLPRFLSALTEHTGAVVSPVSNGIVHRVIPGTQSDWGFAITLIPASDSGPHMAKLGEDRYYKRAGSSFVRMEHFDIADMFGRRPHPELVLKYDVPHAQRWGGNRSRFFVHLSIENQGRGSARAPYLALRLTPGYGIYEFGFDGNGHHGLPRLPIARDGLFRFGGSGDVFVYPGTTLPVTALVCETAEIPPNLVIHFQLCSESTPLIEGTVEMTGAQLREMSGIPS